MARYLILAISIGWVLSRVEALAQTKDTANLPSRQEILEGAKTEGRLSVNPGHDEGTIALLVKAFQKKYPFIQTNWGIVTGIEAGQRQLFEMAAGKSNVDVFSPSTAHWSEYFKQHLFKPYDFRALVKAGALTMPPEMVDDTGLLVWLGTNMGVISYNSKLVPSDKAPKGWESCVDPQWRGELQRNHPWVAFNLYKAFLAAKEVAQERLAEDIPSALVFGPEYLAKTREIFGPDPYPYGLKANQEMMETLISYSYEQGLIPRKPKMEELFAPSTLDL